MNYKKIKKEVEKNMFFFILFFLFLTFFLLIFFVKKDFVYQGNNDSNFSGNFKKNKEDNLFFRKDIFIKKTESLKKSGCIKLEVSNGNFCDLRKKSATECLSGGQNFLFPKCVLFGVSHIKKPEKLRTVYFSSYGASRQDRLDQLFYLVENTEVNSVVIDVKETNGEVYFKIPTDGFGKIKPEFDKILRNPKDLIKKLHEKGIYVIGRVVLFKDRNLVKRRPDLAVKKSDKVTVWEDYRGKTWVDSGSREVWEYNLEISKQAYLIGFDEINLDYVRFPSDGPISDIFFPFSQEEINNDVKWGKARIMENFYEFFTKSLKKEFPEIQISASIFGQAAISHNDVSIGQVLASTLLYFDTVSPMAYPSHFNKDFGNFPDGPDNHPFEVIDKTLISANKKIDNMNEKIVLAQKNNEKVEIRDGFYSNLSKEEVLNLEKIDYKKVRLWLQAFTCTWCNNSISYNKEEIWKQEDAIYKNSGDSWMLWNASSRYSNDYFRKK